MEAAERLLPFVSYCRPQYVAAKHHEVLCEKLEAVERGEILRLIVTMPPRHGKSEYASRFFPAWYLGKHPERTVMQATYNSDLAGDFGYDIRGIVDSEEYRAIFATTLQPDRKAVNRWRTREGGGYLGAGVGTSITGRGAHVGIIDDPYKDREEADSENRRDKVLAWYRSTFYTRLEPNAASAPIVLIMTRWHEEDIAGVLLGEAEHGGETWTLLELPALCEDTNDPLGRKPGQALWPARNDEASLYQTRSTIGPREWSALFQCRPVPEGGDYFQRDWFAYYDALPRGLRYYLTSDFAVSEDAQADYTVHIVWAVDDKSTLNIVDVWRDKRDAHETVDVALDLIAEYRPVAWINEKGTILKSLGPFIEKRMRERRVVCRWGDDVRYARAVDKVAATRSFQARMSMGQVKFPRDAVWLIDLERELLSFPAGKHDDQVDACALMGMHLDKMVRPKIGAGRSLPRLVVNFDPLRG